MAFRKTNKIDKADHQVVKPNEGEYRQWLARMVARQPKIRPEHPPHVEKESDER